MADLNPWDEGYKAPEIDVAAIMAERASNAGKAAQIAKRERTEKILSGEVDVNDQVAMKAIASKLSKHLETRTEENLSFKEQAFYQEFAIQYLKDFDPTLAWVRAGGSPKVAHVRGRQVFRTPYCQQLIENVVAACEQENLVTGKQVIMALWREANYFGEDGGAGSRVRALMGLARIKKMDVQVVEQKTEIKHNVMSVPMPADNDAWALAAEQSQAALKTDVRT